MQEKILTLPLDKKERESLKCGDFVSLSGKIYCARDAAHARITAALAQGEALPFDIVNACVYYCGPTDAREGEIIGSCGPTTSARMDSFTPTLLDGGLTVMIGKGKRNNEVVESIKKNSALYLVAVGGAAALIKNSVVKCEIIAYPDLGCEAVRELVVKDLKLLVAIDTNGNTILK